MATKRKYVDPWKQRAANIKAATKKELVNAFLVLNECDDEVDAVHSAGVHRFLVDTNCCGPDPCFVDCDWCNGDTVAIENTVPDSWGGPGRICFTCLDKADKVAAGGPAKKRQKQ